MATEVVFSVNGLDNMLDKLNTLEKAVEQLKKAFTSLTLQLKNNFFALSVAAVNMRNATVREINYVFKAILNVITVTSNLRGDMNDLEESVSKNLKKMKEDFLELSSVISNDSILSLIFNSNESLNKEITLTYKVVANGEIPNFLNTQNNEESESEYENIERIVTIVNKISEEIIGTPIDDLLKEKYPVLDWVEEGGKLGLIVAASICAVIDDKSFEETYAFMETWAESVKANILTFIDRSLDMDNKREFDNTKTLAENGIGFKTGTVDEEIAKQEKEIKELGKKLYDLTGANTLLNESILELNQVIKNNKLIANDDMSLSNQYRKGGLLDLDEYALGGYTGDGGKYDIAGIVHKGEYVLNQDMVKSMPGIVGWLEGVRKGSSKSLLTGSNPFSGIADLVGNMYEKGKETYIKIENFIKAEPQDVPEDAGKIFYDAQEKADNFASKLEKAGDFLNNEFLKGMSSVTSSVGNIFSSIGDFKMAGGSFTNLFGSLTSGLGVAKAGMGIVGAASAAIDTFGTLVSSEAESDKINAESAAEWDKQNEILSNINESIKSAAEGLSNVFSDTLSNVINRGTTTGNIDKAEDELRGIMNKAYSQRDFGNLSFMWQEKRKKFWRGTERRRHVETFGMDEALKGLGIGGDITKVNLEGLSGISSQLKSTSLGDLGNKLKRGELSNLNFAQSLGTVFGGGKWKFDGVKSSNFGAVANNIDEYVKMIEKARRELAAFEKNATLGDFEGLNVQSVDQVKEQLIKQYEDSGIEITSEIDRELTKLAKEKSVQETMSAQVRNGFVGGLSQGMDSMNIIGGQMSSYFGGMFSNISKTFYDTTMSGFNDNISQFYTKFNNDLADAKVNGSDIFDFAETYNYSGVLNAAKQLENSNNEIDRVFSAIREEAETQGLSASVINAMLPNDEISQKAKSLTESFKSSFSGIFDDMDFSKFESSLGQTIFNTIKEEAIKGFMASAQIENKMTEYVSLINSGQTLEAQELMRNVVAEAKVGYESISLALQNAEQDIIASGLDFNSQTVSAQTTESNQSYYSPTQTGASSINSGGVTNINVYLSNGNYYMTQDDLVAQIREGIKKAEGGEV